MTGSFSWNPRYIAKEKADAAKRLARLEDRRRRQHTTMPWFRWCRLQKVISKARADLSQIEDIASEMKLAA